MNQRSLIFLLVMTGYFSLCILPFTQTHLSDKVTSRGNTFTATSGTKPYTIVIQELLVDPFGEDNALMPEGEWIKLYNMSDDSISVSEWKLVDEDGNELTVGENNREDDSFIVESGKSFKVFRNSDDDFTLNNDTDTIQLFDDEANLRDSYSYEASGDEGESLIRFSL